MASAPAQADRDLHVQVGPRPMARLPAMEGLVVALDGPGSSGKSSVGAAAAQEVGYRFFDTGLLYRALTWLAEHRGVSVDDPEGLVDLVKDLELAQDDAGRLSRVRVDGVDHTGDIKAPAVEAAVVVGVRGPGGPRGAPRPAT